MRGLIFATVVLTSCTTFPDSAKFHFRCIDGKLWAAAELEGSEHGYVAEVGYCEDGQAIIGPKRGKIS